MWRFVLLVVAILQSYYLVSSKNATAITEPRRENCTDPNAERRSDNASCIVTCHKKTLSENPAFCFSHPVLKEDCYCKQNYLLDETTKKCIQPDKCPCNTTANEITRYSTECANTCATMHTFKYCPGPLRSQCWCKYTHCKDANGTCINKE